MFDKLSTKAWSGLCAVGGSLDLLNCRRTLSADNPRGAFDPVMISPAPVEAIELQQDDGCGGELFGD